MHPRVLPPSIKIFVALYSSQQQPEGLQEDEQFACQRRSRLYPRKNTTWFPQDTFSEH